jgi:hypothetical protein
MPYGVIVSLLVGLEREAPLVGVADQGGLDPRRRKRRDGLQRMPYTGSATRVDDSDAGAER